MLLVAGTLTTPTIVSAKWKCKKIPRWGRCRTNHMWYFAIVSPQLCGSGTGCLIFVVNPGFLGNYCGLDITVLLFCCEFVLQLCTNRNTVCDLHETLKHCLSRKMGHPVRIHIYILYEMLFVYFLIIFKRSIDLIWSVWYLMFVTASVYYCIYIFILISVLCNAIDFNRYIYFNTVNKACKYNQWCCIVHVLFSVTLRNK